jgi:hypothetical protein
MKYSGQNSPANIAKDSPVKLATPATSATTIKLSDTQLLVLNAAADHPQGRVEAFPDNVKGGARAKVLEGLTNRGWIKVTGAHLKITKAGFAAIGRENVVPTRNDTTVAAKTEKAPRAPKADNPITVRAPSKQDVMIELLKRDGGAPIGELMSTTGWQQHSVRGCLSTLNKTLSGAIQSAKRDGQRVYWIGEPAEATTDKVPSDSDAVDA